MKAVGYARALPVSDDEALVDLDVPVPEPGPRDLLVSVRAVSVNPVDAKQRRAVSPPAGTSRVLGFDCAGIVQATGSAVADFAVGDAVFYAGALDRPGCNSEFHLVDERLVGRKPATWSFEQAAALPLTAITAWELLFDRLAVPQDPCASGTLLVINGAGGVGSILTQIARKLTGLTVVTTASRPDTIAWCKAMGAHRVIDHHQPLDQELYAIGLSNVAYVASLTASDKHRAAVAAAIAPQGRVALIDDPDSYDVMPFKRKSVSVHWELMFTRSLFKTVDMDRQGRILQAVSRLVDEGVLRSTLNEQGGTINAANLRRAHAAIEAGRSIGKTVLSGF